MANFIEKIKEGRLRNKFILFFVFLAVTPVLVLGFSSLYFIDQSHRVDVSNLELQLINEKIEAIDKFFVNTLGLLEVTIGSSEIGEVDISDQIFFLEGLLDNNFSFTEVSFIGLNGLETSKKSKPPKEHQLVDVRHENYFKKASLGESYIGRVYFVEDEATLRIAAPVKNRSGIIIQILSAQVNLKDIVSMINSSRLGSSGYLYLTDNAGIIIAGAADIPIGKDISSAERYKNLEEKGILTGLDDHDRYLSEFSNIEVVGAGKKIEDIGWNIFAEWPTADADSVKINVSKMLVSLLFFSVIIVIILAIIFAARMVSPIKILERGTSEIAQGNFDKKVEIKTGDELEDLGFAFNEMAKGLKRLDELRKEFVFIAAHELKSPVAAIKGFASLLLDNINSMGEKEIHYASRIKQSSDRLVKLVNDILVVARSEAGRIKVELSACNPEEIINNIINEAKPLADQKIISLSYNPPEIPTKIMADVLRLGEVMMNFVSNAIKYNNINGWVKIYHEDRGEELITHVQDNGFGIPEAEQKKLFEKFFRSEMDKTRTIEGTGLGLFITKELIEKMNGKVWFKSKEGEGTTFSFSLKKEL